MMKFVNEEFKTTFEIPDRPTVRQQLRYKSAVAFINVDAFTFERLWAGLCQICTVWDGEIIPHCTVEVLDELTNPQAVEIVRWAAMETWNYINDLEEVPKN